MTTAYQMPVESGPATRLGRRLWRKALLRKGRISKGGVEVDVTDDTYDHLIQNFHTGAKDQVQFLAGHARDSDLEAFRGDLVGLEAGHDDLLYGVFAVTDRADKTLDENSALGASVSLDLNFQRADGRNTGPTLLHVAGTFDPEVGGLPGWTRADLAADVQFVDFTTPQEITDPAAPGVDNEKGAGPVAQLTDKELAQVRALFPVLAKLADPGETGETEKDTEDADGEAFTDAELTAMAAPVEKPVTPAAKTEDAPNVVEAKVDEPQLVAAAHDNDAGEALDLANARIDAQAVELAAMRRERDQERYDGEKLTLARDFGIPADVTELARPLLFGTGVTLDLAHNGRKVDAGQVMRKVLHELGRRYAKALDLGAEYGTADATDDATRRNRELNDWVASAGAELQGK